MNEGTPVTTEVVAGVLIQRDGKFLVVQEQRPDIRGLWNWPAGKVDQGFTIEATAVKEAKEESGYDVRLIRKLDIWQAEVPEPAKHLFVAEITGGELHVPTEELLDVQWFTKEELLNRRDQLRSEWILEGIERLELSA